MLEMLRAEHPLDKLQPVVTVEQLVGCQQAVRTVHVDEKIRRYITQIVYTTRGHEDLALGGSPRASIALYRSSQALAAIRGRHYVEPDDVKQVAAGVLGHRLILKPESRLRNVQIAEVLTEVMDEVPVPLLEEVRGRRSEVGG
jgi:MoxR-like ATPase